MCNLLFLTLQRYVKKLNAANKVAICNRPESGFRHYCRRFFLFQADIMHIGSTVRGEIREDKTALDAVDAVLPAGTLSGAPKIRAMEIINELENNRRGIYGGAIGYIDFTGNLDTCIAIRIAYKKKGRVYVRSGAGIVADSDPVREHTECINKAKAVVNALTQEG